MRRALVEAAPYALTRDLVADLAYLIQKMRIDEITLMRFLGF